MKSASSDVAFEALQYPTLVLWGLMSCSYLPSPLPFSAPPGFLPPVPKHATSSQLWNPKHVTSLAWNPPHHNPSAPKTPHPTWLFKYRLRNYPIKISMIAFFILRFSLTLLLCDPVPPLLASWYLVISLIHYTVKVLLPKLHIASDHVTCSVWCPVEAQSRHSLNIC